jgi:hypothetical protein
MRPSADNANVVADALGNNVKMPPRGDALFPNLLAEGRLHSPNFGRQARVYLAYAGIYLAHTLAYILKSCANGSEFLFDLGVHRGKLSNNPTIVLTQVNRTVAARG